ncbi:serine hydrolase domain-containing protein [Mycolicibacterium thermoresistibile]
MPRPSRRMVAAALGLAAIVACGPATQPGPATSTAPAPTTTNAAARSVVPHVDFAPVADVVNEAIAAHRLPGAVVEVGHAGEVVYRQAFGSRKLPGEPGLGGSPSPAEPMTVDTIFDLASLTKSLATTVAVLQLYEQGRLQIDDAVQRYLPEFNPQNDPRRARVTLRMLLTHTSGIAGDLSLDGPWGLDRADKAEGVRRALGAWVVYEPGRLFHYSDIGFILLGAIVEKLTGEPLDVYVTENVFAPLGMADTRYLPATEACGRYRMRGTAIVLDDTAEAVACGEGAWSTDLLARIAPTSRDGDTPGLNPNHGHPLRGTVHDPTARRMGGVSGSAGVFSTAQDVGTYAQALLDRLGGRPSTFPLQTSTLALMTSPQQPDYDPAIAGQALRGFGWDIDTNHSSPRGSVFPVGSFGHTGFTGVTLWMDPGSNTYVIVLANVIHQPGGPPIAELSGEVATRAARALQLYGS